MYVAANIKDPYPGRCGCRSFNQATGQYERCLGYADKPHICQWENAHPPEKHVYKTIDVEPDPWVSPLDAD